MPFLRKPLADLTADTAARLVALGYTDAAFAGTAARNILEAIDDKLDDLQDRVQAGLSQAYFSQATGAALDALGQLLGVSRYTGEPDQTYRARIAHAPLAKGGASLAALEAALHRLTNVRRVIAVKRPHGPGSLTFYLVPVLAPLDPAIVTLANEVVGQLAAAGATTHVTTPTPRLVNLTLSGTVKQSATVNELAHRNTAVSKIATFIANLTMGAELVLDQVIAHGLAGGMSDLHILTFSTTDALGMTTEQLLHNYRPLYDEKLEPGQIVIV